MAKHLVSYFDENDDRKDYLTETDVNMLDYEEFVAMVRAECHLPKYMPDYEIAPAVESSYTY